jgi:hypothetical protein
MVELHGLRESWLYSDVYQYMASSNAVLSLFALNDLTAKYYRLYSLACLTEVEPNTQQGRVGQL